MVFANAIVALEGIGFLYPMVVIVTFLYAMIFKVDRLSFNIPMFIMIFIAFCSLLLNIFPSYFKAWMRFGFFLFVIGLLSPLIQTEYLNNLRIVLFDYLLKFCIIVTLLSFIAYLTGVNLVYIREIPGYATHFGGILSHSMLLAPVASIATCYIFYLFLLQSEMRGKFFFFTLFICFCLVILLTASRIAMSGTFVAISFLLLKSGLMNTIKLGLLLFVLFFLTSTYWLPLAEDLIQKQEYSEESGSLISTRGSKWDARIYEFRKSPLYGVGFNIILEETNDNIDKETGRVEPGSSWLSILSMLGILGFIPFAYLIFSRFIYLIKRSKEGNNILLASLMIFFMIHMIAEAYVLFAGGVLFYFFWLTIGVCYVPQNDDLIYKYGISTSGIEM